MKIYVNHVFKTAGTSIFAAFETAFQENKVISTLSYFDKSSITPLIKNEFGYDMYVAISAPSDLSKYDYVHGHFKQLFFDVHCGDFIKIGTSREPLNKYLSAAKHILRDRKLDKRGRMLDYILKKPVDMEEVARSLIAQSHVSFYGNSDINYVKQDSDDLIACLYKTSMRAVDKYHVIIDSDDYDQKLFELRRAIPNLSIPPRLNTANQFESLAPLFDEAEFLERLKRDFKLILEAEYSLYDTLRSKSSEEVPADFLAIRPSSSAGNIDFTAPFSTYGFDIRVRSSLYGREREFSKRMLTLPSNPKIDFQQDLIGYGGVVEIFLFFWTSCPEQADNSISITLNTSAIPVEASNKILFIDNPSRHLFLLRSTFRFPCSYKVSGLNINNANLVNREIFCCGGKYYAHA